MGLTNIIKSIFVILILSVCCVSYTQVSLESHKLYKDDSLRLILIQTSTLLGWNEDLDENVLIESPEYQIQLSTSNLELSFDQSYSGILNDNEYQVHFTQLPIMSISTIDSIYDEPKTLAKLSYTDDTQYYESSIGIEIRGGVSQTYPKKTYDLELWKDDNGDNTDKHKFGDLRKDDDWILDGLYNEPLRIRSHVAHNLWLDLHSLYYNDQEPNAKAGAEVMFVELWIDGRYNGIYNLSEQVDKKQLKLKDYDGNIDGELYKGIHWNNSTFKVLPDYTNESRIWDSIELKYPKEEDTTEWALLYDFVDFILNSDEDAFSNDIWNRFDKQNNIDYLLYLNLLRATDNTGKNIYIAKYQEGDPYFYVPWDLDGSFGTIWNGDNDPNTNSLLINKMYERLLDESPEFYKSQINAKWYEYRQGIFSEDSLLDRFDSVYSQLLDNNVYERERLVFGNYTFDSGLYTYLKQWISDRLSYLDQFFEAITISTKEIVANNFSIMPNPVVDNLYIKLENYDNQYYTIYNVLGNNVQYGPLLIDQPVSTQTLSSGMYIMVIEGQSLKFIKE